MLRAVGHTLRSIAVGGHWRAPWESFPIYSYGVMLGLSFVVGWYIVLGLTDRQGLDRKVMADCYVFTAFSAIVGSRVLYILTNLDEFRDHETHALSLFMMLRLRSGGLVAYGGFLGGLLGSTAFLRSNNIRLAAWADAAVPSLGTGLCITRLGCYMYGCDFGRPLPPHAPAFLQRLGSFPHWADNKGAPAWQQHVEHGFHAAQADCVAAYHGVWNAARGLCRIPQDAAHSVPVHPTQLYESLTGLTLFVLLMAVWRRRTFEGQVCLAFWILYGVARSALEIIRDDLERGVVGPLSTSQFIGLTSLLVALPLYLYLRKNGTPAKGVNLFEPVPAAGPEVKADPVPETKPDAEEKPAEEAKP
ncbi:MAG: prolipoprotein diacylglyceryl transferase [Deltaproteobacteria bacterium]|nr:prolipoprotein diacylglyceryl transferase [Deltaproteobacteria bacterium]